jgi:hypothetical protein
MAPKLQRDDLESTTAGECTMVSAESSELARILERVTAWPTAQRIDLARRILESIETPHTPVSKEQPANETPAASAPPQHPPPRGYSAAEVIELLHQRHPSLPQAGAVTRGSPVEQLVGMAAGDRPPPNDEEVQQWIDEHRMEKYGR